MWNPDYQRQEAMAKTLRGETFDSLRRVGAAATHGDRRTRRNRDRSSQNRRAINDARD